MPSTLHSPFYSDIHTSYWYFDISLICLGFGPVVNTSLVNSNGQEECTVKKNIYVHDLLSQHFFLLSNQLK